MQKDLHTTYVSMIESSDFDTNVINHCKSDAQNKGYELVVDNNSTAKRSVRTATRPCRQQQQSVRVVVQIRYSNTMTTVSVQWNWIIRFQFQWLGLKERALSMDMQGKIQKASFYVFTGYFLFVLASVFFQIPDAIIAAVNILAITELYGSKIISYYMSAHKFSFLLAGLFLLYLAGTDPRSC